MGNRFPPFFVRGEITPQMNSSPLGFGKIRRLKMIGIRVIANLLLETDPCERNAPKCYSTFPHHEKVKQARKKD